MGEVKDEMVRHWHQRNRGGGRRKGGEKAVEDRLMEDGLVEDWVVEDGCGGWLEGKS